VELGECGATWIQTPEEICPGDCRGKVGVHYSIILHIPRNADSLLQIVMDTFDEMDLSYLNTNKIK
jgi:hypothetical protein